MIQGQIQSQVFFQPPAALVSGVAPGSGSHILTEGSDRIATELGDELITEQP